MSPSRVSRRGLGVNERNNRAINTMATKQQVSEANGVYFITVTCHGWMNLFDRADAYDAVYTWFNVLKKKGHYIPAYVIMPNHFHVLIAFSGVSTNINRVVGNGKRFMAYD
ncbi:MAG: transposase, partial [Ginsengibacter sp.]